MFAQTRCALTDPSTTRLIDKVPLNLVFMDVIRRVFPDAPVLMGLHDRECIWSSFRQAFEPNQALVSPTTSRAPLGSTTPRWTAGNGAHSTRSSPPRFTTNTSSRGSRTARVRWCRSRGIVDPEVPTTGATSATLSCTHELRRGRTESEQASDRALDAPQATHRRDFAANSMYVDRYGVQTVAPSCSRLVDRTLPQTVTSPVLQPMRAAGAAGQ